MTDESTETGNPVHHGFCVLNLNLPWCESRWSVESMPDTHYFPDPLCVPSGLRIELNGVG